MGKRVDLTGRHFGRWLVIGINEYETSRGRGTYWNCACECENKSVVSSYALTHGLSKSCGCFKREKARPPVIVSHGQSNTRLYQIWKDMKGRCNRPTSARFYTHGARGISVCDEWMAFEPFYKWAISNGYREDLTIDRIDNDGNYCPENCRWATPEEQGNNRRTNCFVEYNGKRLTIAELARLADININTLRQRLRRGVSVSDAINKKRYKKGELKHGKLDI